MKTEAETERKCKTCGSHGEKSGECHNGQSKFFLTITNSEGSCEEWNPCKGGNE